MIDDFKVLLVQVSKLDYKQILIYEVIKSTHR